VQEGEGEWLLLSNDDVILEAENCDQLLLDARFELDTGKCNTGWSKKVSRNATELSRNQGRRVHK